MSAIDNLRSWLSWHYQDALGGKALWEGIGEFADDLSDLLRVALRSRFSSIAPADALPEIAFNQFVIPTSRLSERAMRDYLAERTRAATVP